ncbi:MAG: thiamine-phosphate kinase [Rhodomicrobium sp.]|nr:thiamine-phosphate kinase [Rhodomicrobium sp.]
MDAEQVERLKAEYPVHFDPGLWEKRAELEALAAGALGLIDDAAVVGVPLGHDLVVKADAIIGGVHFFADDLPDAVAKKALRVNLSDLAAKGAKPIGYLMALALPAAPARTWLRRFASGLDEAQRAFGCHLMGGDTDCRPGPLSLSITVFGSVPSGRMVRRGSARVGDQLFVTGTLGDAALGLALLKEPALAQRFDLDASQVALMTARFLRPQPRLGLRQLLLAHASAAMDLSDGLMKDCGRMCAASGVAASLEAAALPLNDALRKAVAEDAGWLKTAASAGDDYEILAAIPTAGVADFTAKAAVLDFPVARIGQIREGAGVRMQQPDGADMTFDRTGWDHFLE